jgi:hypothetical protein
MERTARSARSPASQADIVTSAVVANTAWAAAKESHVAYGEREGAPVPLSDTQKHMMGGLHDGLKKVMDTVYDEQVANGASDRDAALQAMAVGTRELAKDIMSIRNSIGKVDSALEFMKTRGVQGSIHEEFETPDGARVISYMVAQASGRDGFSIEGQRAVLERTRVSHITECAPPNVSDIADSLWNKVSRAVGITPTADKAADRMSLQLHSLAAGLLKEHGLVVAFSEDKKSFACANTIVTCGQVPIPETTKDEIFTPRISSATGLHITGDIDTKLRSPGDMVDGFIINIKPTDGYEGPAEQRSVPFDPWLTPRQEAKVHSIESTVHELLGRRHTYVRSLPPNSAMDIVDSEHANAMSMNLITSIENHIDAQGLNAVDSSKLMRRLYPDMSRVGHLSRSNESSTLDVFENFNVNHKITLGHRPLTEAPPAEINREIEDKAAHLDANDAIIATRHVIDQTSTAAIADTLWKKAARAIVDQPSP